MITEAVPLKRWGQPEDVALMALFLASSAGDWITGRMFDIDGGIEFSPTASDEMFSMMEQ
jgi:NAD(P)-dependent dehydrogenase (short-subunit alcohol dehydrogenase family)